MPNSILAIFADDQYEAFLNGEKIAENNEIWWQGQADQIALQLSPGDYVLAIKVVDVHIRGGLAAALTRDSSSLLTTGGWKANSEEVSDWQTLNFDDSSWVYAKDMGSGWAEEYHGKSIDVSANGNQAKWIWHPDFDHQQTTIYFRRTFTVDEQGLIVPPANIAPIASIRPRVFAPGLILNVGENFNSLLEANDPDQDIIATYTFTTTSQAEGDGYFQRINGEVRERITALEFTIAATDLNQLEWVAGEPGTTNRIGVRATDSRGGSSNSTEAVPWSAGNSRLAIVVDNSYKAWLNGALLGENPSSFEGPIDFFDLNLQPGTHVLAIEGNDLGGPAAAIAALTRGTSALTTSRSWKISTEEAEGWQEIDFNDSAWGYAREYDSGTWDFKLDRDNFLVPTAKWIWDHNLYDTDKAYLRFKFEIDANGQIVEPPPPSNKAPFASVQPWNFNPDEIVNIGSAFGSLFSVSDPDGDPIVEYEFFDNNLSDVSGNFYRVSTNERYTTNQFSIKAEDLHDLEWRAGIANSIDGIRLKATDQYGATNEWQAENAIWRSRRQLSINSPVVNEGELIPFTLSRFDQIAQQLGVWLQVNSGLELVEIEDDEIRDRLNRGERILLPFEEGASSIDFNYFTARRNNIVENDPYPALDISLFADASGGEPLISSLAKASDVTPIISVGTTDFPRSVTRGQKLFFILERESNTQEELKVSYSISGNAIEGVDYKKPSGNVIFEPKEFIKFIEVETLPGSRTSPTTTIQLNLQPGTDYFVEADKTFDIATVQQPIPEITLTQFREPWSHVYAGTPRKFVDFIQVKGDLKRDSITEYKFKEYNNATNSGYFRLDGRILPGEFTVKADQINDLEWIFGHRGTKDRIDVSAVNHSNQASNTKTTSIEVGIAPTSYAIESTSGFQHVTEGDSFQIKIRKLDNFEKNTTLQWAVFDTPTHPITATRDDFHGIKKGWNQISFNKDRFYEETYLNLQTILEGVENVENSETSRIWFYNEELSNGKNKWDQNPAYSYMDFSIHDTPYYWMDKSTNHAEGELASMNVARFGGYDAITDVVIKPETLGDLYKDQRIMKLATGLSDSSDYLAISQTLEFSKDGLIQSAHTKINRDSTREIAEAFAWSIYDQIPTTSSSKKASTKATLMNRRLGTIFDSSENSNKKQLLSLPSWQTVYNGLASIGGFFSNLGSSLYAATGLPALINSLTTSKNSPPPRTIALPPPSLLSTRQVAGTALANVQGNNQKSQGKMGVTEGPVTTHASAALVAQGGGNAVKQQGGSLVAQGGGNLVAQGGGTLVAQGGGNLVAQGGGTLVAQGGGTLVAQGGGNLVAQGGGNLVAQGGGNLVSRKLSSLDGLGRMRSEGKAELQSVFVATPGGMYISADGGQTFSEGALEAMKGLLDINGKAINLYQPRDLV